MPLGNNVPPQPPPPSNPPSLDWQQHVIDTEATLAADLKKLLDFIASPSFQNCAATEQILLQQQREAMKNYDDVLNRRIKGFNLGENAQSGQ